GYTTGAMAIRVAHANAAYGLWKYIAFQDSNITGNAASATKLQNPRTVSFSGAATGSFSYDGSGDSSALLTLANSGVLAGTYGSPLKIPVITVNQKGLLTVVSEQNIPVGLEKNQVMRAGNSKLTASATLEQFLDTYYGLSVPFFENGAANLFGPYSAGLVSSYVNGGTFAIGASINDGHIYGLSVPQDRLHDAMQFEFYTTRSLQFNGNAVSASKLQNPRTIFGQTFDGSGDIGGTLTASTGLVQSDEYHYIDIGRNGLDRMSFYNFNAIFNFIDSKNGNIVARITENGIDCNAATASKLQNPRNIALSGAVNGNINFDGSGNVEIITNPNTHSLRVVEGDGYTITYEDARRIAIIQMTLWTNKSVVSQTLYEASTSNRHQIYSLPIMLKKRISTDVQLSEEETGISYNTECAEWLKYAMPDGYRDHDATSKLFAKFVRWAGANDEPVSAIATVVGIF
ncbi:MAG: hypothetical protein RSC68_28415, partial [Acinetobacter sp.]